MFRRYWWMFPVMMPVGMLGSLMLAAVITYVMPKEYESYVTVSVKPVIPVGTFFGMTGRHDGMTEMFFATEFEKIKSRNSLSKVVDALELTDKWGMDKESAFKVLKKAVRTKNVRDSGLIRISVRHTNKEDARDIAADVVRAYGEYRKELESKAVESRIAELKRAVIAQEDKVKERSKATNAIGELVDSFDKSDFPDLLRSTDRGDFLDMKRKLETEQSLLENMRLALIGEELKLGLVGDSIVINDDAAIANAPFSPNVTKNLLMALAAGVLISPCLALPLMAAMHRKNAVA